MDVQASDFITIALLVILEGLLSADNALVLAILVLGLPKKQQRKALRYGILGSVLLPHRRHPPGRPPDQGRLREAHRRGVPAVAGVQPLFGRAEGEDRRAIKPATAWMGLSPFWATVVKVELTDIVFAVDSILVAVAMSRKEWVIITGGILGIIAMRMVIGQLLRVVRRYPALVDAAFVIIAWVAIKLLVEYLDGAGYIDFHISKWVSFGLIVVIFGVAYFYARKKGAVEEAEEDEAATLLEKQSRK